MKKRLMCFFVVLSLLVSIVPGISFAAAADEAVTFYDADSNAVLNVLDGASNVYAVVNFDTAKSGNADVVSACYNDNGEMISVKMLGKADLLSGTYTTPAIDIAGASFVKLFAWDGINSMKPLLKTPGVIGKSVPLPTATTTVLDTKQISEPQLTFAMNFKADPATVTQLAVYGDWYSDFVLTVNKDVTYNADGSADGYLAGQYDSWSKNWLAVPNKTYEVKADTPVKIMESAAAIYGKKGLKYTYHEVYDRVKDFDCGVFFNEAFLTENPDLKATLELRIYNPKNPDESYRIGESYEFTLPNAPAGATVLTAGEVTAVIPSGVILENGTDGLKLTTNSISDSQSGITADENEKLTSYDIHIDGVAKNNTTPIIITFPQAADKGLNKGNLSLYHVENGEAVAMEEVETAEDLTKHNQFTYEPLDGTVTLAMATFSEIALLSDNENAWNGEYDYSWYDSEKTELKIANADQLAGFGAIVGGMAKDIAQDSFTGKTVTLNSDINIGDLKDENGIVFYPIGYHNSNESYEKIPGVSVTSDVNSFEGTFDGNGNTISNFYQNTWEMFGDYNDGYTGTPNHYKDAMGLFGYVLNGTVKNLTVDNFSSDGEFTPTGVIAAYASNSKFENIAITNCNPRVYNTGNGGIVGIGGNSSDPDTYKLTFNNITIDNSNKITALWGSWDVACGGLVGMFRGAGHAYMTNCHVAAQIDVYNDVCGNYQYYWYRYAGMMIGTNKNMITDEKGYTVPETSKFHAENCTVHFGDWNNYWYCELVANSIASYTHDHQFSRLTRVDSVDVNNKTVTVDGVTTAIPTSGRANYVVVKEPYSSENATCYHFVDGNVWNHEDAGKEVVDVDGDGVKEEVLKEDRQHYYLPFNQLFTGYGWGVKHIPVYNGTDYAFEGITILDRDVADSVVKFNAKNVISGYTVDTEYAIGALFEAADIADKKLTIKPENVQVTVSPADENSTVAGTYVAGETGWENGTLTFSGAGKATITITDYYFCTPTTITVDIVDFTNGAIKTAEEMTGEVMQKSINFNNVWLYK